MYFLKALAIILPPVVNIIMSGIVVAEITAPLVEVLQGWCYKASSGLILVP